MQIKKFLIMGLGSVCLALSATPIGWTASGARVAWTHNTVQVTRGGRWVQAYNGIPVAGGAYVRTGNNSRAQIHYADGSVMRLGSRSVARIREAQRKQVNLNQGKAYFKVKPQPQRMKVQTRNAVATVMGTEFVVEVKAPDSAQQSWLLNPQRLSYGSMQVAQAGGNDLVTQITTISGLVGVSDLRGGNLIEVGPGMSTFVGDNLPPQPPTNVDTEQLQQNEELLQEDQFAGANDAGSFANSPMNPDNPQQQTTVQQNSPGSQGNLDTTPTTGSLEVIIK